jgi:hypothetical protein
MSFTTSVFGGIVEWFLGRVSDRRQYKRRAGAFRVWYVPDPANEDATKHGIGLELSPNGITFILNGEIPEPRFRLTLHIRDRDVAVNVKTVRQDQLEHEGQIWNRYIGQFAGIAAESWDTIVAYVNDSPEPDRRKLQNQKPSDNVDDAYPLLPTTLQQKLVALLVAQERLGEPKTGERPLLKLFYGGIAKRPGQPKAHRFNVHSRVRKGEEMMAYDTRLLIDEQGEIIEL